MNEQPLAGKKPRCNVALFGNSRCSKEFVRGREEQTAPFACATCGEEHDLDAISFGADAPAQWDRLTEAERSDSELTDDVCMLRTADGETHFFVRSCLEIPVRDGERVFIWGVWVSVSESTMREMFEQWEAPARVESGPYFGWLCTALPGYPDTMFLKTRVHQRPVGERPLVELEPTEHPLAVHQREGVDAAWLRELLVELLHPKPMVETPPAADWPFDQPPNCAVITLRPIVFEGAPILHVTHDENDHGWQFLGWEDADVAQAAHVVALDPSVLDIADLPPGWHAWRSSRSSRWQRALKSSDKGL